MRTPNRSRALHQYSSNSIAVQILHTFASIQNTLSASFVTGPPNGSVLFCWLSSLVVCSSAGVRTAARRVDSRRAGGRARGRSSGRHCPAGQYGYVPLRRHLVLQEPCRGPNRRLYLDYKKQAR